MAHAAVLAELQRVRVELDRLVGRRSLGGFSDYDARRYDKLAVKEKRLLAEISEGQPPG